MAESVSIPVGGKTQNETSPRPGLKASPPKVRMPRPDARAIAKAAVSSWARLQSRLVPIIGEDGFRVLYARSLHRARLKHPWLARDPVKGDLPYEALHASLEMESAQRATEGSRALRENFNDLLNSLIGEELATRLMGPA
jgi:hypothetical protein